MNSIAIKLVLLCAVSLSLGCQSNTPKESSPSEATWNKKMRSMAVSVKDLIPYMFSKKQFADPNNRKTVEKLIRRFSEATHSISIKDGERRFGKDPLLTYAVKGLKENMDQAYSSFQLGNLGYSRHMLVNSLGVCFQCHTSAQRGPMYKDWDLGKTQFSLSAVEQAKIYIAIRNFDKAVKVLETQLQTAMNYQINPVEQENALKAYLSLMIRVKTNSTKAFAMVDHYLKQDGLPIYLKENALQWKQSLRDWVASKGVAKKQGMELVKELIKKAQSRKHLAGHEAGNIEYMRASSLLHLQLASTTVKEERAQIYHWLGKSYDSLIQTGFWELPETYYEACIVQWPKSSLAKKCFKNYERNIIIGFSGSAGIFLPNVEKVRMAKLKNLAGY